MTTHMLVRRRRVMSALALVAVGALALSACSGGSAGESGSAESRAINTEFTTPPSTFDPALAKAGDDYVAVSMLYSTLTARDLDGSIIPNLASSWETKSASEYVLTIRDDATCDDGTPITPTVVAESLKYLADNSSGTHPFTTLVFGQGAPTITPDDAAKTVTVQLGGPYGDFLAALSASQSGIVCPAGLADKAGLAAGTVRGAFSGPYTVGEVQAGVQYSFDLREDFDTWIEYSTPLDGVPARQINFIIKTDPATTANKLQSGDLDVGYATGDTYDRFKDNGDYQNAMVTIANVYVLFNQSPGHYFTDKPDARKAVAQAIDRGAFNKVFSNDLSPIFNSIVPADFQCAIDDESLIPATDSAAAAGVLNGATINFPASLSFGDQGKGAEYVAKVLTDAGATVNLEKLDNATWATNTQNPDATWDVTLMGDINPTKLVSTSLTRVIGPTLKNGGRNLGSADNPEGVAALTAAAATADPAEQCAQYEAAQKSVLTRFDAIPLAGIVWSLVSANDVTVPVPGGNIYYPGLRISA